MSRIFISHSSKNDDWAIALRDWLIREGWSGDGDIFLDLDPKRGIAAGQRWAHALEDAATRCEAVLYIVSEEWLGSKWCGDEYQLANKLNKRLFALLIDDVALERLPGGLTAHWQVVRLKGEPAERFVTIHPLTQQQSPVHISVAGLTSLKRGLDKAGIGAETFELQRDPNGPFGRRAPYRGLEALEPEDAAVFFGRNADIVRGIDTLRGLAAHKPPRLMVILGASGAGKSSFLRAGLWPRLLRDDAQWLPLRAIRAGRGGAIEGNEGLLAAIEDVHQRFALRATRANLRERLAAPERFVELLGDLRQAAARRALISDPPYPLPVICLDQGEEVFASDASLESKKLVELACAAIAADAGILLVSIRSDSYGAMQSAAILAGIDQTPLSLGPVPRGEIARVIGEPAEILRREAGPTSPVFDAALIERLQQEIEDEADALPLLAFVLQRLMREHRGISSIGLAELERTGGVAAAIESAAEAALGETGFGREHGQQRDALRRLFIPRLARIDPDSKAPQRRVARQSELPKDLQPLARALTERRLLVVKAVARTEAGEGADTSSLEVAHEALLRRWPTLAALLDEDRDALLLLDGVLSAAADWDKADLQRKPDYLAHRGSRLDDAQALAQRGFDWEREITPARAYLAACAARETAEREEKEAALRREQEALKREQDASKREQEQIARTRKLQRRVGVVLAVLAVLIVAAIGLVAWQRQENIALAASLQHQQANLLAELADAELLRGNIDGALQFAVVGVHVDQSLPGIASLAAAELAAVEWQTKLRLVFSGHTATVNSAFYGPDGKRIVTASDDKTSRVWDAATGKQIVVLEGHRESVNFARFSSDGTRVVTASYDKTAALWDAASGKQIVVLSGHTENVWSAAFSPDGTRVITGSSDNSARIWDAATGRQRAVLSGHTSAVVFSAFSPDGTRVVTGSTDTTARIWDAATGRQITLLRGHADVVNCAVFSPDGKRIVTASIDKSVRIWDAATGKQLQVLSPGVPTTFAAFSPDGARFATTSDDKTVRFWDAATGNQLAVWAVAASTVAFSPDGKRFLTASLGNSSLGEGENAARLWDMTTSQPVLVLRGHTDEVNSAAFSPDGARIVTASEDKTARVWDAATGKLLIALSGHADVVNYAAFSPDGTRIVTASDDGTARIWDAKTGKVVVALSGHTGQLSFANFSPDGTRVVTASRDKTARLWDVATGKPLTVLEGPTNEVVTAAFSPDGKRVVTASEDQTVRTWDAATGKQLISAPLAARYAAFSPDGTRIVVASIDDGAHIVDAGTGKELLVLRWNSRAVNIFSSAAFSPDGRRVVTASGFAPTATAIDKTVNTALIWDAATGKQIAILPGQADRMVFAAFSPDGRRIAVNSDDKTVSLWDVQFATMATEGLIAEACTRRLLGLSKLTRDQMRLAGFSDNTPLRDVCAANQ